MSRDLRVAGLVAIAMLAACTTETVQRVEASPSPAEPSPTLAERVEIDNIAILQGTTSTIVNEGVVKAKRNAPVLAGRPGLVRVHARALDPKARLPKVAAELRIVTPGKNDLILRAPADWLVERDDSDLDTTFNFVLDADALTPASTLSVAVGAPSVPGDRAVFPSDGSTLALGAREDAPTLRVRFVPVRYDQDGSGRLPQLDASTVEAYRNALYAMYPTRKVEVDVREALPWANALEARGKGWDELLDTIIDTRREDAVDDDVYYVGIFTPKASADEYCKGGCILGLAPAAQLEDVGLRVAMVVGYKRADAAATLAHELAHAMGREHAPCGDPEGIDESYPYPAGAIGVAGWHVLEKKLVDPKGRARDFMSYCGPAWVSDYTYTSLHDRMVDVARLNRTGTGGGPGGPAAPARAASPAMTRMRSYHVMDDGSLREGAQVDVIAHEAVGEGISMRYEDAAGKTLAVSSAVYRRLDSLRGGIILAPEPPRGAARAQVEGLAVRPLVLRQR